MKNASFEVETWTYGPSYELRFHLFAPCYSFPFQERAIAPDPHSLDILLLVVRNKEILSNSRVSRPKIFLLALLPLHKTSSTWFVTLSNFNSIFYLIIFSVQLIYFSKFFCIFAWFSFLKSRANWATVFQAASLWSDNCSLQYHYHDKQPRTCDRNVYGFASMGICIMKHLCQWRANRCFKYFFLGTIIRPLYCWLLTGIHTVFFSNY